MVKLLAVKTALTIIGKAAKRMKVCYQRQSYVCQCYHLYANPQCHNFPPQQVIIVLLVSRTGFTKLC
jgi:hypothetical protein